MKSPKLIELKPADVEALLMRVEKGALHKDAYWKSKSIICNNSMKLLEDCFAGKKIDKTECDTTEVDETIKLAGSLGITGTPAIILPDGRLRTGAMPESELLDLIDGKK